MTTISTLCSVTLRNTQVVAPSVFWQFQARDVAGNLLMNVSGPTPPAGLLAQRSRYLRRRGTTSSAPVAIPGGLEWELANGDRLTLTAYPKRAPR